MNGITILPSPCWGFLAITPRFIGERLSEYKTTVG